VLASPATRRRARESGIDLTTVVGSGRDGRIQRQDLDAAINQAQHGGPGIAARGNGSQRRQPRTETEEIRILGVRRVSAQRVAESKRNIPHFAYVEEVDITELERLRKHLNSKLPKGTPSYTYLPFLGMALIRVIERFPKCNSRYDSERNVLVQHRGVNLGRRDADERRPQSAGRASRRGVVAGRAGGADPPRRASGARRHCEPQRAERLDDHDHESSASWAASSRRRSSTRRKSRSSASTRQSSGRSCSTARSRCA
jgi:pyruvate/2-oxoglutarate dehydrogenase complex dihydrolipoamide acyltransferase (E2) component